MRLDEGYESYMPFPIKILQSYSSVHITLVPDFHNYILIDVYYTLWYFTYAYTHLFVSPSIYLSLYLLVCHSLIRFIVIPYLHLLSPFQIHISLQTGFLFSAGLAYLDIICGIPCPHYCLQSHLHTFINTGRKQSQSVYMILATESQWFPWISIYLSSLSHYLRGFCLFWLLVN